MGLYHPNTLWINTWIDRMMEKYNVCGCAPIEGLAFFMGESGNENPSNDAVYEAKRWLKDPSLIRLNCQSCYKCDARKRFKLVARITLIGESNEKK